MIGDSLGGENSATTDHPTVEFQKEGNFTDQERRLSTRQFQLYSRQTYRDMKVKEWRYEKFTRAINLGLTIHCLAMFDNLHKLSTSYRKLSRPENNFLISFDLGREGVGAQVTTRAVDRKIYQPSHRSLSTPHPLPIPVSPRLCGHRLPWFVIDFRHIKGMRGLRDRYVRILRDRNVCNLGRFRRTYSIGGSRRSISFYYIRRP